MIEAKQFLIQLKGKTKNVTEYIRAQDGETKN